MSSAIDPSPEFLRAVRRRLVEVAGPSAGRGRFRWLGWFSPWGVLGFCVLAILPMSWAGAEPGVRHVAGALFMEWVLYLMAERLVNRLTDHPHHLPYTVWPASEQEVVQCLLRSALISTLPIAFLFVTGAMLIPGVLRDLSLEPRTLLLAALCLPLLVIRAWVTHRWRWIGQYLFWSPWLGGAVALVFVLFKPGQAVLREFLAMHGDTIALLYPTGWIFLPWSAWIEGGPWILFSFILPLPVVLLALPTALRELQEWGRFRDRSLLLALGEIPEDAPEEFSESVQALRTAAQTAHSPGPTANTDAILSREFLKSPLETPTRWVDRMTWRWWTPSQRLAAECLSRTWPQGLTLNGSSGPTFYWFGLGAIPLLWGGIAWESQSAWNGSRILAVIAPAALALVGVIPWFSGFSQVTLAAVLPIGLWDIALVRWKHTALRCAVAFPIVVVAGAGAVWFAGEPIGMGAALGFQLGLAPVFLSPIGTVYGLLNKARVRGFWGLFWKGSTAVVCLVNILGLLLMALPAMGLVFGLFCLGLNTLLLAGVIRWFNACRVEVDSRSVLSED
ncbi:MAG: hypothetical protein ACO3I0_09970 [Limisphaerales bacterium]